MATSTRRCLGAGSLGDMLGSLRDDRRRQTKTNKEKETCAMVSCHDMS